MESLVDPNIWLTEMKNATQNTALEHLGIEIASATEERIVLRMPITDKVRQPMGLLHGGINLVLAESAASIHACWGIDLTAVAPVGIEISASHLRSARDGWIRAEAVVLRRAKQLIVHEVDIVDEARNLLLSKCRVTNFYKVISAEKTIHKR